MGTKVSRKLVIGWFSFTCSGDGTIVFVELMNDKFFEWKDKIEFRHFNMLKSRNELKDLDVAFVEGAISTKKDLEKIKKIRKNCKKLVAVGACAITGMPAAQRNNFNQGTRKEIQFILDRFNHLDRVYPVGEVVKVDDTVPGCPIAPEKLNEVMNKYLAEFGR